MHHGFRYRSASGRRGGEGRLGGFLIGAGLSTVILFGLCSVFAYFIDKGTIPIGQSALFGKGCFAAAVLIGCFLTSKLTSRRKLLSASAAALLVLLPVMFGTAAATGWENMNVLTPIIITGLSCLMAVLITARKKRHGYG